MRRNLPPLPHDDLLLLAQGILMSETDHKLIITDQVTGSRAQHFLQAKPPHPGKRYNLSIDKTDPQEIIVFFGVWGELGVFVAREAETESEVELLSIPWSAIPWSLLGNNW